MVNVRTMTGSGIAVTGNDETGSGGTRSDESETAEHVTIDLGPMVYRRLPELLTDQGQGHKRAHAQPALEHPQAQS